MRLDHLLSKEASKGCITVYLFRDSSAMHWTGAGDMLACLCERADAWDERRDMSKVSREAAGERRRRLCEWRDWTVKETDESA